MWIAMDPYEGDTEEFDTELKAIEWANERIESYLDGDGWNEGVDQTCVCKLTHRTVETNVRNRKDVTLDENGCDEHGLTWSSDWDFICEYKLEPVKESPPNEH